MSPEPFVRGQALVLALLFIASSVLGSPLATLVCASTAAALAWSLKLKYRREVAAAAAAIPLHRERLDRIVAGDAQAALGIGLAAGGLLTGFDVTVPEVGLAPMTPVVLAATAAAIYLSSLVDWYVILPRISGLLGPRPCRPESHTHPGYPRSWRETTRWWYIHRSLAALALRFGLAFAVSLTVERHLSLPGGTEIVTAAGVGLFAAYVAAVPYAIMQAGHPTAIVGRTIRVHTRRRVAVKLFTLRGHTFRIPRARRVGSGEPGPREYVYDVALEGVQLVPAKERERRIPRNENGDVEYERDPRKIKLKRLESCVPAERPFAGCETECSGINWYCIENPRGFEPK